MNGIEICIIPIEIVMPNSCWLWIKRKMTTFDRFWKFQKIHWEYIRVNYLVNCFAMWRNFMLNVYTVHEFLFYAIWKLSAESGRWLKPLNHLTLFWNFRSRAANFWSGYKGVDELVVTSKCHLQIIELWFRFSNSCK